MIRLSCLSLLFKPGDLLLEVCPCELVVEFENDIRHGLESVEKALIQAGTIYGFDGLSWC